MHNKPEQHEQENDNHFMETAKKITEGLLKSQSYVDLDSKDLQEAGLIDEDETILDYVYKKMKFNVSIQDLVLEEFYQQTPPPLDSAIAEQWQAKKIFSLEEENKIRLNYFQNTTHSSELIRLKEIDDLISIIVAEAEVLNDGEDETADPKPFRRDVNLLMKLFSSKPKVINFNDQLCWGIYVPQALHKSTSYSGMFASSINEYIVVANPEINGAISSSVFSKQKILKYFLKKNFDSIQFSLKNELESEIRNLSLEKYEKIKKEVTEINNPIRFDFFNHMLNDLGKNSKLELVQIFRSHDDVRAFNGEKVTEPLGIESGDHRFIIKKDQENSLVFSWTGKKGKAETIDGVYRFSFIDQNFVVKARIHDGHFEYAQQIENGQFSDWMTEGYIINFQQISTIKEIFEMVQVANEKEWQKNKELCLEKAHLALKELDNCNSSTEYTNQFKNLGIGHYPGNEIIINPEKKVSFIIEVMTPKSNLTHNLN